jgi:hypothetical protein
VVPEHLWRQRAGNPFPDEQPGTIVVDPDARLQHLVEGPDTAMRYGVGTGSDGYDWHGVGRLQFMQAWPRWKAPDSMIARRPEFAPYSVANGGMDPGPGNPLGARAQAPPSAFSNRGRARSKFGKTAVGPRPKRGTPGAGPGVLLGLWPRRAYRLAA